MRWKTGTIYELSSVRPRIGVARGVRTVVESDCGGGHAAERSLCETVSERPSKRDELRIVSSES